MKKHSVSMKAKHTAPLQLDKQTQDPLYNKTVLAVEQGMIIPVDDDQSGNGVTPRSIVRTAQQDESEKSGNGAEKVDSKRSRWKNLKKILLYSPRRRKDRKAYAETTRGQAVETTQKCVPPLKGDSSNSRKLLSTTETFNMEKGQNQEGNHQETSSCKIVQETSPGQKIAASAEFGGGIFPKKVVSNRGTFPWRRNMAPEFSRNMKKGREITEQSRGVDGDHQDLSFIRESMRTKQDERLLLSEKNTVEEKRKRIRRLNNFKQRIQVPSFRSGRDIRQQPGKSQGNVDDWTGLARNAFSVPSILAEQHSLDSEKDQTQSLRYLRRRTSSGHDNRESSSATRSPKYPSPRSWTSNRKRTSNNSDDLESPWGVKGELSSGGESMSRQLSRSFLDSIDNALIHVSDIVTTINQGFRPKKQGARDSGFSDSQDGTVGESGEDESNVEGEAVEMLRDAFVEYTTRARQSSSKTFVSKLRRKSAIL